jgi:dolichyl-phosphate beta-glucosyltransferase
MPHLSVVAPNYNEEDNLKRGVLDDILSYLSSKDFSWEIVLINDGSTDDTLHYLNDFAANHQNVTVVNNPHMGKAASIITGAQKASGDIVLFTDMDQSTPISEFDKFIPHFESGAQVVIGTRAKREGAPLFRQILAYSMVMLRSLVLQLAVTDSQCGFKAYSAQAITSIFPILKQVHPPHVITHPTTNPGFDLEILYLAKKFAFKIIQVPVKWHYFESKRVSFLKDSINGVKELFLVRYRSLTNAYILDADGK